MAETFTQTAEAPHQHATGGVFGAKALGWETFEFARNPYYNVIVISFFAPYFASQVVGDPTLGQTLVSAMITLAGIIMAFVAPVLGALIDKGGYRKPPTMMALGVLCFVTACLWFVTPATETQSGAVVLGFILMATGYVAYTIAELFHNAMLPASGSPKSLPMVSAVGLSMGNFAGILALLLISSFLISENAPDFGFDKSMAENIRITGPLVALWLAVFILPFFLFMPDIDKTPERSWRRASKALFTGKGSVFNLAGGAVQHVKELFRLNPNVMRFLVARMLYADGIAALLTIGSTYVSGFLGWSLGQLILFNILGAICAVIGALLGGFLDRIAGPKRSIMVELAVIMVVMIIQFSVTPSTVFFGLMPSDQIVWAGSQFDTLGDLIYLLCVIPAGLMLGAVISSSRYMLVHISPPKQIGQFFGFYAMAGNVTVWMGPGLVALMTFLSNDQRIGVSALMFLFLSGFIIISGVRSDRTPEHLKATPKF